jgi:mannitol/fructose-specific phosphotransferase system IIA component (Ntr-type)
MPGSNQVKIPSMGSVLFGLDAATHLDAIEQINDSLSSIFTPDVAARLNALVLARESLASTYLDHQIALPHARFPDPAPFCIGVALAQTPIAWGPTAQATRLVILSIVPNSCATDYLGFIRNLAYALRDLSKRTQLLNSPDRDSIKTWFNRHLSLT